MEAIMNAASRNHGRCINYIEFNVSDMARTKEFYGRAFGWTFTDYGPDYCEFTDARMKGGFDATAPVTPGGPLVVLYGDDLPDIQAGIAAVGGKIVKPIFEFRKALVE